MNNVISKRCLTCDDILLKTEVKEYGLYSYIIVKCEQCKKWWIE